MKTFFLIFCILANHAVVKAQSAYRITYEGRRSLITMNQAPVYAYDYTKVVFNDSLYFSYPYNKGGDPMIKNNSVYGSKILHHATWYNPVSGEMFDGVAWPRKRKPYIVRYKTKPDQQVWVIDTAVSHFYKNYRCQKAYSVLQPGDTSFIVYTADIPYPYGTMVYKNLPGLILELYNTGRGYYLSATKIEKGNFLLGMPVNAEIRDRYK